MKSTRIFLIALLAFGVSNCTDQGPFGVAATSGSGVVRLTAAPQHSLLGGLLQSVGLLKCTPLSPATATATIGPWGGSLAVGPHTLVVPPGALSSSVTITGSLSADTINAITFKPEGLQFVKPAYLTMSYANCNLVGILLPKQIAYTNDNYLILELLSSLDNIFTKKVTGQVHHFSHYAIAW